MDENGVTQWRATYDGDGARRKRLDGKGTIHHVGPYERSVGNGQDVTEVVTKCYTAGMGGMSRLVAMRKNGVLAWVGTDHKFTSQIEDESIGLYWYASRAYDPMLGRFCQPDILVPRLYSPQTLGHYSYVLNNPLRYTDPTGMDTRGTGVSGSIGGAGRYVTGGAGVEFSSEGEIGVRMHVGGGGMSGYSASIVVDRARSDAAQIPDLSGPSTVFGGSIGEGYVVGGERSESWSESPTTGRRPTTTSEQFGIGAKAPVPVEVHAGVTYTWTGSVNLKDIWDRINPFGDDPHPVPEMGERVSYNLGFRPLDRAPETNTPVRYKPLLNPIASAFPMVDPGPSPADFTGPPVPTPLSIPADVAPGGVGVVNIIPSNLSGSPAGGGSWDSPGGANAQADAAARRAAWERAGSPDYNELRRAVSQATSDGCLENHLADAGSGGASPVITGAAPSVCSSRRLSISGTGGIYGS